MWIKLWHLTHVRTQMRLAMVEWVPECGAWWLPNKHNILFNWFSEICIHINWEMMSLFSITNPMYRFTQKKASAHAHAFSTTRYGLAIACWDRMAETIVGEECRILCVKTNGMTSFDHADDWWLQSKKYALIVNFAMCMENAFARCIQNGYIEFQNMQIPMRIQNYVNFERDAERSRTVCNGHGHDIH